MKRLIKGAGLASCLLCLSALPALALVTRAGVSRNGTDSGSCQVPTPCRTIAYALTQTAPGGEVLVLDSGGYGTFTVTQPITINAPPGVLAFVTAPSGDAITINAAPTDLVILTGFYIDGAGTGNNGIQVNSVGSFSLGGSTITNFAGAGLNFVPSTGTGNADLTIHNSTLYKNAANAVVVQPAGSQNAAAAITSSTFSSSGILADGSATSGFVHMLLNDCTIRYQSAYALSANAPSGSGNASSVRVQVNRSAIFQSNAGLVASGNSTINLNLSSMSNITTVAATSNGGAVNSYGNNGIGLTANPPTFTSTIPTR